MAQIKIRIPYVEPHGNAWRYRRIVPKSLRGEIGKRSWTKTFPINTPLSRIEQAAKKLAREHDRAIAIARGKEVGPEQVATAESQAHTWLAREKSEIFEMLSWFHEQHPDDLTATDRAFLNAVEHDGRYIPESLTTSAALDRDIKLYGGDRDNKPLRFAVNSFIAAAGDKDVKAIVRADVIDWLDSMTKKRKLAPATIQRRLGALRAMINRAYLDLEHDARNPFAAHKIKGGDGRTDDRLPFNKAMILKIESHLSTNRRLGHETKNILRIMRNTGAGPGEVGGLVLADVSLVGKIPYVWIRPNALRGLKTGEVRERRVPLLGAALEAAKDAQKRARIRRKGNDLDDLPLFQSFGINGRGADSISAKLNKAIRAAGVPKSKRLTSYSFRHTMKEALRSAGVADHVQRRLLGHAGQGVADRYGSPSARLEEARDALQAAMKYLGNVDESIYGANERL